MSVFLLLLIALIVVVLLWFLSQRREHPRQIEATDAAIEVRPTKVMLPDEGGEPEDRSGRRRTGETQELGRKVVHGPYRAIDDRGPPSEVEKPRQS